MAIKACCPSDNTGLELQGTSWPGDEMIPLLQLRRSVPLQAVSVPLIQSLGSTRYPIQCSSRLFQGSSGPLRLNLSPWTRCASPPMNIVTQAASLQLTKNASEGAGGKPAIPFTGIVLFSVHHQLWSFKMVVLGPSNLRGKTTFKIYPVNPLYVSLRLLFSSKPQWMKARLI